MEYYLNSGEVLYSREPCRVRTVLGSCVGVAVYDPVLRAGGLCHYLLPEAPADTPSTRYGDVALPFLLQKFQRAGSRKEDLRTWIIGGALLLDAHEIFFVGDRNAEFAESWLKTRQIRVVANETRGYRGRKVVFETSSGQISYEELSGDKIRGMMII